MIEISAPNQQIGDLFNPETPNSPILFAALAGHMDSTILVDDPSRPSMVLLRTLAGHVFSSRQVSEAFLRGGLRKLQSLGPVAQIVSGEDRMSPKPDVTIPRFEYMDHDPSDHRYVQLLEAIPEEMAFRSMDADLLARCQWRDFIEMVYGSLDRFLDAAYGYCLMDGERIVTEIYGAFIGAGRVEIGVVTTEEYRRRGFARLASAFLIRDIHASGLAPYLSCDQSNLASSAIARQLGFRRESEYALYGYRPLVVPAEMN